MKTAALITGASNGIGLEFARILASEGHDLVVVARSGNKLRELKQELESKHKIQVTVLEKDLSEASAADWVFGETKKANKHIDILVNNAGFGDFGSFLETKIEKEEQMINLNILTLTKLCKLYAQEMAKKKSGDKSGKILNVASTAAFQAGPSMAVYFATKAYVLSFTEALAIEFAAYGISITALCPGPTNTGFMENAQMQDKKMFSSSLMPSSLAVAKYGLASLNSEKTIAVHGFLNYLGTLYAKFLPRKLVAFTVRFLINLK